MKVSPQRSTFVVLILLFIFTPLLTFAQTQSGTNTLLYGLIGVVLLLILGAVMIVSGNLLKLEAKRLGADDSNISVVPNLSSVSRAKLPEFVGSEPSHLLKAGYNMNLDGKAEHIIEDVRRNRFALQPGNFIGISPIPKVVVEVGDTVKAGDAIMFDKKNPDVIHTAPVSGEVIEINRGAKRAISEVVILADKDQSYRSFEIPDLATGNRDAVVKTMLDSGVWSSLVQRPYGIFADHNEVPRDIFVSTFCSSPLAPDSNFVAQDKGAEFQRGIDVLNILTGGKVYLGMDASSSKPSSVFMDTEGVERHWFKGAHPYGNVGVQIHHIKPIKSVDKVWTIDVQAVITLGNLFLTGQYKPERLIAIAGSALGNNHYVRSFVGANVGDLIGSEEQPKGIRLISGDVLSGEKKKTSSFLNLQHHQISALDEGDYYETFGWLMPGESRPTISKTYLTPMFSNLSFQGDTNLHGERRAFVVTGEYERVLPMDIYPQFLMKSILFQDFERMEGLGILELLEEDVALCEFACTSKIPLQQILRDGLTLMQEN